MRTCHLKDFEIGRQDCEKRWGTGRSSEVKKCFWWRFFNFLKSYIFVWQIRFFPRRNVLDGHVILRILKLIGRIQSYVGG